LKAAKRGGIYLLLGLGVLVAATPYLWMISSSFKDQVEIFAFPPTLIPQLPTLANYSQVMSRLPLARIAFNSAFVSLRNCKKITCDSYAIQTQPEAGLMV